MPGKLCAAKKRCNNQPDKATITIKVMSDINTSSTILPGLIYPAVSSKLKTICWVKGHSNTIMVSNAATFKASKILLEAVVRFKTFIILNFRLVNKNTVRLHHLCVTLGSVRRELDICRAERYSAKSIFHLNQHRLKG